MGGSAHVSSGFYWSMFEIMVGYTPKKQTWNLKLPLARRHIYKPRIMRVPCSILGVCKYIDLPLKSCLRPQAATPALRSREGEGPGESLGHWRYPQEGTNKNTRPKALLKDDFLFPQVGYVSSLEGNMMLFYCSYLITQTARSWISTSLAESVKRWTQAS